jgi:hypothetical protein
MKTGAPGAAPWRSVHGECGVNAPKQGGFSGMAAPKKTLWKSLGKFSAPTPAAGRHEAPLV